MSTFAKLVDEVFVGRMSGPPLADDKKDALLGWLDTIPLLPNPPPSTAAAARARGDALFHDAKVGCAACHAGDHLTNNGTVDVGTNLLAQVPSLRGVVWRAPFLHDGCAPTLRATFWRSAAAATSTATRPSSRTPSATTSSPTSRRSRSAAAVTR